MSATDDTAREAPPRDLLRRMLGQYRYWQDSDRAASWLQKRRLAVRSDCYVSSRAQLYHIDRIRLSRGVKIHERAMLNYRSGGGDSPNIFIGEGSKILPDAKLVPQQGTIRIGRNCTIQYNCLLYGVGGLEIGDDSRIAAHTIFTPMNHIYADPLQPIWRQGESAVGIRIGRDVWIGSGVRVMDGVTIGDGSVIGAGSVVTKNIPPFSVAVGVPARVIRQRGPANS